MNSMLDSDATPIQRALAAVRKLESQLAALRSARNEPLAIVGMACRLPSDLCDPQAYWEFLLRGGEAIAELAAERTSALGMEGPFYAGALADVTGFDRDFFELSAAEAEHLDPQHRLLAEVAWHAFEDSGIVPSTLEGSRTGTFVGICAPPADGGASDLAADSAYDLTGRGACFAAGRLAYHFGLQGPCLALDTACSSSLVAVDLACKSLRLGECDLALAAGVNLMLSARTMSAISATGALSSTGACRPFDARADGFVRGEGCGVVVLKRLRDAQRDGDRIWATIVGTGVNQDGRSSGLTAPNGAAQETLLRETLQRAQLTPSQIGYVEAHGTGTSLGDPIELESLRAVYGQPRADGSRCVVGSVKSAIGHLEAAAGIAGLIKAALIVNNGILPPQTGFSTLNPRISLTDCCLEVATERRAWHPVSSQRMAAVSSFGMSGTNAHAILAEPPEPAADRTTQAPAVGPTLFTCSALTRDSLTARLAQTARWLETASEVDLRSCCASAYGNREQFGERAALLVHDVCDLRQKLGALAERGRAEDCFVVRVDKHAKPKVALLFSGQGSQYPGMARQLYDAQPQFRATLDRCAQLLQGELDEPLLSVMFGDKSQNNRLARTEYTQPALFSVCYALAELLRSWGVQPDVVLGHSIGEIVAACVAGVLELPDALRLVAARGRIITSHAREGAMLAVRAGRVQIEQASAQLAEQVEIAAINGPEDLVLAGSAPAIAALEVLLTARAIKTKRLAVSHAFHSAAMEPALEPFARVAESLRYHPANVPVISNVSGTVCERVATAAHWVEHLRRPVLFHEGLQTMAELDVQVCIECGPRPSLLALGASTLEQHKIAAFPTLRPGRSDVDQLAHLLARIYVAGVPFKVCAIDPRPERRFVALPPYPFARDNTRPPSAVNREAEGGGAQHSKLVTHVRAAPAPAMPQVSCARALVRPPLQLLQRAFAASPALVPQLEQLVWNETELFLRHKTLAASASAARAAALDLALAAVCAWLEAHTGEEHEIATQGCALPAHAPGALSWCARRWCAPASTGELIDLLAFDAAGNLIVSLYELHFTARPETSVASVAGARARAGKTRPATPIGDMR
jgi:acyl transferase domain-containing protein